MAPSTIAAAMTKVMARPYLLMPTAPQVGPVVPQLEPIVENGPRVKLLTLHHQMWSQPCTRAHMGMTAIMAARPTTEVYVA